MPGTHEGGLQGTSFPFIFCTPHSLHANGRLELLLNPVNMDTEGTTEIVQLAYQQGILIK